MMQALIIEKTEGVSVQVVMDGRSADEQLALWKLPKKNGAAYVGHTVVALPDGLAPRDAFRWLADNGHIPTDRTLRPAWRVDTGQCAECLDSAKAYAESLGITVTADDTLETIRDKVAAATG